MNIEEYETFNKEINTLYEYLKELKKEKLYVDRQLSILEVGLDKVKEADEKITASRNKAFKNVFYLLSPITLVLFSKLGVNNKMFAYSFVISNFVAYFIHEISSRKHKKVLSQYEVSSYEDIINKMDLLKRKSSTLDFDINEKRTSIDNYRIDRDSIKTEIDPKELDDSQKNNDLTVDEIDSYIKQLMN